MLIADNQAYLRITMRATQESGYEMGAVALHLYDLDSLYELSRLAVDPVYSEFQFSRFALYRNGRRLKPEDKMQLEALSLSSPIVVATAIGAYAGALGAVAGATWIILQVFEKLYNLRLEHEKLELEVQKLRREVDAPESLCVPSVEETSEILEQRNAGEYLDIVKRRLGRSPLAVDEVDVEAVLPGVVRNFG